MRRSTAALVAVGALLAAPAAASADPAVACPAPTTDPPVLLATGERHTCTAAPRDRAIFRWLPASPGATAVDLEGTTYDAVLDVHVAGLDGSLGDRLVTWDHGDPRAAEHVTFDVPGDAKAIAFVVRAYRTGDGGTVGIAVYRDPPANAGPEGAQPIALDATGTGAAGMQWGPLTNGLLGPGQPARWFAFSAPRSGRMTASTCTPYAGDTSVSAYEVSGGLDLLAANDDTPLRCERSGASFAGFPVVGGRAYRIAVRLARGPAAGPETLVLGWDDTAPDATVDVGPSGVTSERSAAFGWSSRAADAVGFECSLDGSVFAACPPAYGDLQDGDHAFRVRAVDAAGNVGPAAERAWRVDAGAVAAAAPSRGRRIAVTAAKVTGPRAARARALAKAFDGGPRARFAWGRRGTSVLVLSLRGARPGTSVQLTCARRGNGCPFATRSVPASTNLARLLRGARLSAGAVLELRVTRPGTVGRLFRWTVRKERRPTAEALCLPPGTTRPSGC